MADTTAQAHSVPADARRHPDINQDTAFFWEGAREGLILIQECVKCGELRHPPRPCCPRCQSLEWKSRRSTGRGNIYSYTVYHHPPVPGFDIPYVVAVVELDEGTRLVGNIVGSTDGVDIGAQVKAVFVDGPSDMTMPAFSLAVSPEDQGV